MWPCANGGTHLKALCGQKLFDRRALVVLLKDYASDFAIGGALDQCDVGASARDLSHFNAQLCSTFERQSHGKKAA